MSARVLLLAVVVGWAAGAQAQEALRASLAGQQAAEARKAALASERFNVEWGPISLRANASLQTEANDNIRLTKDNREVDMVFRPQVNVLTAWQVSDKNRLTLSLGGGYAKYVRATDFDSFFLTPNSDLSFDVYVDDFIINLHDRFSYSQDVSTDPTISGIGSLSRFENYAGFNVGWDLNKAVLTLGYDHANYIALDQAFQYQDNSQELLNASAGFTVTPTILAGVEVGGGLKNYTGTVLNDNQHFSAGPFTSVHLSDYSQLRASAGYTAYFFDSAPGNTNKVSPLSGFYLDIEFRHRINASITHSLSIGRQLQSGLFSQTFDLIYVRHEAQIKVFRKTSLSTSLSYEHIDQSGVVGFRREVSDRYGFGLALSRPWTDHLSSRLSYQFYLKRSDFALNDYLQNRLVLDLNYGF